MPATLPTMNMLDEGTEKRSALEINEELSMLGANLNTRSNLDISSVSLSALKNNLNAALDIYADVLLNPAFPENELERLKKERISTIKQEKASPFPMALRVLPQFIYGKDHAYGNPFTGSGTEESVTNMRREDLRKSNLIMPPWLWWVISPSMKLSIYWKSASKIGKAAMCRSKISEPLPIKRSRLSMSWTVPVLYSH
jgi:hypothetical protein